MKAPLLLLPVALVLYGCQTPNQSSQADFTVPDEVAKSAQYPPKPADHQEQVEKYLSVRLKDPDSAIYSAWLLRKAHLGSNPPVYGWMSFVSVNAKNGFGGYVGLQLYKFWHQDGEARPVSSLPHPVHVVPFDIDDFLKNQPPSKPPLP